MIYSKGRFFCYFIAFSLYGISHWAKSQFDIISIDELISTLWFSQSGLFSVDKHFIITAIKFSLVIPLLLLLSIYFGERIISIRAIRWLKPLPQLLFYMPLILVAIALIIIGRQLDFAHYFRVDNAVKEDFFAQQYRDPGLVTFHASAPKNLIVIYVESLEANYADTALFPRNLLAPLTKNKEHTLSFARFEQALGAQWTIAAVVSSQCGIPLFLRGIFNGNKKYQYVSHFLPQASCLSDILAAHGYTNIFLKGASLSFAGFAQFLKTHHYDLSYGKEQWLEQGYKLKQFNGWGLPDDLLFAQAKKTVRQLMHKNQRFNLTLLTLDTHGPHGHLNQRCRAQGGSDFSDVVTCSANEVADFIEYIKTNGWLDEITVVVMGDHLAMKNPLLDSLKKGKNRFIFNTIISNQPLQKNTDTIVHFDWLPTLLRALGFSFEGGQLGLGYAAIGSKSSPNDFYLRFSRLWQLAEQQSPSYEQLWRPSA